MDAVCGFELKSMIFGKVFVSFYLDINKVLMEFEKNLTRTRADAQSYIVLV